MPMLPAPYRMSQQGSSWGGFGRAPRQQVPGAPQGMGAYAGAGNMPPAPQLQGMGQRQFLPEMAAQQRPQMMASALMSPQQQGMQGIGMTGGRPPGAGPNDYVPPGYGAAPQAGVDNPWANIGPEAAAAMRAQAQPMPQGGPQQQLGNASGLTPMQPQMGIAQAAPQQGHPAMARPMPPPTGYAR